MAQNQQSMDSSDSTFNMGFWKKMLYLPLTLCNSFKHIKNMILEGPRADTNSSQIEQIQLLQGSSPVFTTDNHHSSSTLSIISPNRNSAFGRIEQSNLSSNPSPSLLATVIETSHNGNVNSSQNYNIQLTKPLETPKLLLSNGCWDVAMNDDELVSNARQNVNLNDGCNLLATLPDVAGFKNDSDLSEKNDTVEISVYQHHNKRLSLNENVAMFLTEWSFNAKLMISSQKSSKVILSLTGTLLGEDQVTVLEKSFDAGVLQSRKKHNLVKTSKGLYHLVGKIIEGSPYELYQTCISVHGIPRNWKKMVKELLSSIDSTEEDTKNMSLNFSLDSFAKPIKPVTPKVTADLSMCFTRNKTANSKNTKQITLETFGKRKSSEAIKFKSKIKKRKLHQKIHNETATESTDQILNHANNYIKVKKHKRPFTKKKQKLAELIYKRNKNGTRVVKKNSKVPVFVEEKSNEHVSTEPSLFGGLEEMYTINDDFKMGSPKPLSVTSYSDSDRSRSESPPVFYNLSNVSDDKSLTYSNPPSPIDKSIEAEALKRIKAPKITTKEKLMYEIKHEKLKKALERKIKSFKFDTDCD